MAEILPAVVQPGDAPLVAARRMPRIGSRPGQIDASPAIPFAGH
jgi:hypothetical protein